MNNHRTHWIREIAFKYLLLSLIYFIFLPPAISQGGTDPNSIDIETAKTVAINYCLNTEAKYANSTASDIILSLAETGTADKIVLYYVFNINKEDGFIIISADRNSPPVLCYVPEGSFDLNPQNRASSFNDWLEAFAIQIKNSILEKTISTRWQKLWDAYTAKGAWDTEKMTLNLTTRWHQGYNKYAPVSLAGCVAVAMSQIINYYQWPINGIGDHNYADLPNDPIQWPDRFNCGYYEARYQPAGGGNFYFNNHSGIYDYTKMANNDFDEVSRLMYNVAVSVDMDWTSCGSWASTPTVVAPSFKTYFNYSQDAEYVRQVDYTDPDWTNLLKQQIQKERPVLYRGLQSTTGWSGHAWVCLGYKTISNETQYYFNMGRGDSPGYYTLTNTGFTFEQGAVINIFPPVQPDLIVTSASASEDPIISGDPFMLNFVIKNNGSRDAVASTAACYLSADQILDKYDVLITSVGIQALTINETANKSQDIIINPETSGNYYILIEADTAHYVHESLEDNNIYALPITVQGSVSAYSFRSKTDGSWNNNAIWEYNNGSGWEDATFYPTGSNGDITIMSGHTVTLSSSLILDEVTIQSGGQLTISSGVIMTIAGGPDDVDFEVNGILVNSGTINTTGTLAFNDGSTYQHAQDGGTIPVANWATASNCYITGIGGTRPTIPSGTQFGNFEWNCTSQTDDIYLAGKLNTIMGNFNILSTHNNTANNNALILGNGESGDLTIYGNFSQSGYSSFLITDGSASRTMTVIGDFSLTGSNVKLYLSGGTTPNGSLYLAKNYTHTSGTIYGPGEIVFNGISTQTYTSGGTVSGTINYTVSNGSYLQMAAENTTVSGIGSFTLSSGATLGITSSEGIATSGTTGNIRTGTRSFSAGANYNYNGAANQSTGNGLPANLTGSLTIDNTGSSGNNIVTLAQNTTANSLIVISGVFAIGTKTLTAGSLSNSGSITINSTAVDVNGSMIVTGAITQNSGSSVTYNRLMPSNLYRYISSPVSSGLLPAGHSYWLWDEPSGEWTPTPSCESGRGYTVQTNGSPVSFTGSLVTSASQTGTAPYYSPGPPYAYNRGTWGGGGWNLLGNPFTSAMSAASFISTNTGSLDASYQALYIYDGNSYKYAAALIPFYPIGESFGEYIQAGQGFFVLAKQNNVSFSFTSNMQTHNTSVPMTKSAGVLWPGVQLKVRYGKNESSTLVVYNEMMTPGLDPGYDVGLLSTYPDVEIYTALALKDNSVNFARQALPLAGIDTIAVPVGIDSEKESKVTFSAYTVPFENYKFWLEDRKSGIYTDLSESTYTVNLPAKTYGTGRFFIIATTNTPTGIDHPQAEDTDLRIWTSNEKVIIKGKVSDKAICEVYNMNGEKMVVTKLSDGELNTITMPAGSKGVYIVKITDGVKMYTQKIAIL
jgi:hypothetical protein